MPDDAFNSRGRWGRRLAFPLAALAVVAALQAYWLVAAACALAGIVCLRLSRR